MAVFLFYALWISHTRTVSRLIIGFSVSAEDFAGKQKCTLQLYGANEDLALLSNKWCSSFLSLAPLSHKHTVVSLSLTPVIGYTAYFTLSYQYSHLYLCFSAIWNIFVYSHTTTLLECKARRTHVAKLTWIYLIILNCMFILIPDADTTEWCALSAQRYISEYPTWSDQNCGQLY